MPNVVDFLQSRKVSVVFDVGANEGFYGQQLRDFGYRGHIISFEPVEQAFQRLQARACSDGKWIAHNYALGKTAGSAIIHVSRATAFSSMLPLTEAARAFGADLSTSHEQEIAVKTLDEYSHPWLSENIFLKVDTQGSERAVLAGADATLASAVGVQLELAIIHLYENAWSMTEAIDFMAKKGFLVGQISPVNYFPADPATIIDFDWVFRRMASYDHVKRSSQ